MALGAVYRCSAALLLALALPLAPAEELGHALVVDDECLSSESEACTLSALQLRGQRRGLSATEQDDATGVALARGDDDDTDMSSLNPTTPCSGTAALPAAPVCYSGTVMVENFAITIKSFGAGSGVADLVATGAMPGSVLGATFSKSGQTITVNGLDEAFEGKVKISTVEYCSEQDEIRVTVTDPLPVVVALTRTDCSKLALLEVPQAQDAVVPTGPTLVLAPTVSEHQQMAMALLRGDDDAEELGVLNPETPCAGEAELPAAPACYSGTVMVENFAITIKSYQAGKGVADLVATGAMPGSVLGASFSKSGRGITVDGLDAAFEGQVKISKVEYCSSEDQIRVSVTEPLEVVVALTRADCNKLALVTQSQLAPADVQEPAEAQKLPEAQAAALQSAEHKREAWGWGGSGSGWNAGQSVCEQDTYGTCSIGWCASSRGPTQCTKGKCLCPPGWCATNGACFPTIAARSIETGGTCSVFGCASSRGETDCIQGKCVCKAGYYSYAGTCYPVTATGGSCNLLSCASTRGPTDCVGGSCLCKLGYVAVDGRCQKTLF